MSPLSPNQVSEAVFVIEKMMGNTVSVETYTGDGAFGPAYAAAVNVTCGINMTHRLVQTANGEERVSIMVILARSEDAGYFAPESKVTYNGRVSKVLETSLKTFKGSVVYAEAECS